MDPKPRPHPNAGDLPRLPRDVDDDYTATPIVGALMTGGPTPIDPGPFAPQRFAGLGPAR